MVYYHRTQAPVYSRLSYVNFKASESGHFVGVTQRVVEDRFLSSYSFFFAAWILHAGFPTVGLSSKFGLQRGVVLSQGNISIHGLDLWYRLRHMKTNESLLTLASQHLTASICSADLLEYLKVSESI